MWNRRYIFCYSNWILIQYCFSYRKGLQLVDETCIVSVCFSRRFVLIQTTCFPFSLMTIIVSATWFEWHFSQIPCVTFKYVIRYLCHFENGIIQRNPSLIRIQMRYLYLIYFARCQVHQATNHFRSNIHYIFCLYHDLLHIAMHASVSIYVLHACSQTVCWWVLVFPMRYFERECIWLACHGMA